jgi:hypothetical protein
MAIQALSDITRAAQSAFAAGGGAPHVAATPPADPVATPFWVDLDGQLAVWDGAAWFEVVGTPVADGAPPPVLQATLTVSPVALTGYAEIIVTNASVSATSRITAALVGQLDAENDLEEIQDSDLRLFGIPEAGQVRFVITANSPIAGPFNVNYEVYTP